MINLYGNLQVKLANTDADRMTYTPLVGEPIWCVETNLYYMGDGSTVGGILVNNNSDLQTQLDQLRADLEQEILDRENGDEALGAAIDIVAGDLVDEEAARIAADGVLQTNINNEASARMAADTVLQGNIDAEQSAREAADVALQGNIDAEESARIAADVALQGNIDAEESARIAADGVLQTNINTEANTRADADTLLQTNINNEASAREAADTVLQGNIDAEESARIASDNALDSRLDTTESNIGGLVVDLAAEVLAREGADTNLQTQINDINNDIDNVNIDISALQDALADETAARIAADGVLQTNINNEASTRETADNDLSERIDAEELARQGADATLQTNINNEASARTSADNALGVRIDDVETDLSTESADRIAADLILQGNITAEESARIAADGVLQTNINNEASARDAADQVLEGLIGDEASARTSADNALGVRIDDVETELALKANTADLAAVATSGLFADLLSKPTTLSGYGITDAINVSEKGANNGVATLDGSGKIPTAQLPPIAISDTFVVANEAAQLALTVERGDIAVRTDQSKSYINTTGANTSMADWTELLSPPNAVLSVNGQVGVVVLDKGDVGLGNVDNTSDLDKPISTATQTALDGKVDDFTSQTANTVFAAPNGSAGLPVFRALGVADIPSLSSLYVINGRTVSAGTGLTGGGDLSTNRTIGLDAFSVASLALADSSVQTIVQGAGILVDATDPNNPIISATATAPTWGTIVGTLSDQTDLQTALNAKANTSSLATVATSGLFADLLSKPTTLSGYGITDAVPNTRTVTAGNGMTGGGALSANITLTMGTPTTLTASTSNAVTSTSHTHAITGFLALTGGTMTGAILGPNGSATAASFAVRAAGYGMYSSAADDLDFTSNGTRILNLERGEAGANSFLKVINYNVTDGQFGPDITVDGTPTDISIFMYAKGAGRVVLGNGLNDDAFSFTSAAAWSGLNVKGTGAYLNFESAASGAAYIYASGGSTTNVEIDIYGKGTAGVALLNGNSQGIYATGTATVSRITAVHSATNANLEIGAKGTGVVNVISTLQQNGVAVLTTAAIGSTVQAYNANLTSWAALATSAKANAGAIGSSLLTMTTARLLGRTTSGTGAPEELTVGTGLSLGSTSLTLSANLQAWSALATSSKADSTVTMTAGDGLTGGGTLAATRTFTLGTPSTLTASTSNAVTSTSHTHAITGFLPLTGGTLTGALSGTNLTLSGTGVGRMESITANATGNLTTTVLNRIVKKTNTTAYSYTIPSALGSDDDTITVLNAGSAGDITVVGSGVTLYRSGTSGSVTVPPYSSVTFVRVSSTIWVA